MRRPLRVQQPRPGGGVRARSPGENAPAPRRCPDWQAESLYAQLGGGAELQAIISIFVDRLFRDPMIGYLFRGSDAARIKRLEFEFAANHLGGPIAYTGRPLGSAHRRHQIQEGHFNRRLHLLRQTLVEQRAPEAVVAHWTRHTLEQKAEVMGPPGACGPSDTERSGR